VSSYFGEGVKMNRIIPQETYKFIEGKLHSYEQTKFEIEEWRLSVKYPENKQAVPGVGYISDPTANQAVRFAEPPKHIRDCEKWVELIDKTREYCRQHRNKVFDVWYGKQRQTVTQAYTKSGIRKKTFEKNRNSAVYFLLIRAINAGLYKLKPNMNEL
jgi:hypothetical protein